MATKELRLRKAASAVETFGAPEAPGLAVQAPYAAESADSLAGMYLTIQEQEKNLEERKAAIRAEVVRRMAGAGSDRLATRHGSFRLERRRSLSWSLDDLKAAFGPKWTAFVKADDKLVRVKMEEGGAVGDRLAKAAGVKVVEAVSFGKS